MTTALTVISLVCCVYIVVLAICLRLKNASDHLDHLVRSEHRDLEPASVRSAFTHLNPSWRFRRYVDDESLVTRTFTDSRSALADESR